MIRRFLGDTRGNFALITTVAIVPIMGALALAIDYTEMSRQRLQTMNALDAAGIATASRIIEGATDAEAKAYAKTFFEANLGSVKPSNTTLTVILPQDNTGGGTLNLSAALDYYPFFYPVFANLIGEGSGSTQMNFSAEADIRLKNTLEVALVLDNSGSMKELGKGSSQVRFDLLKKASKQLVDTISGQAALMKQVSKPVQFALVPFAASVNVGANNSTAAWMDQDGISPVHHENFDWTSFATFAGANRKVTKIGGVYYKTGSDWGSQDGQKVTRFTLFNEMKYYTNSSQTNKANYTSWQGCVETRPSPYDVNDAAPDVANPATLFVPMFAPDENSSAYNNWFLYKDSSGNNRYWSDVLSSGSYNAATRQAYMPKYFDIPTHGYVGPYGTTPAGLDRGPNSMCTTKPIMPLTDVSVTSGKDTVKAAIDAMVANGATNVPEGMAWGWRVISSGAPFTDGRPDSQKGNDKIVIVLTDGANTYYTPSSLSASDPAGNKSVYSNYGYAGKTTPGYTTSRIFQGTSVSTSTHSNANYTKAMNQHFDDLDDVDAHGICDKAKAAGLIVMTVALDLDIEDATEKGQIDALKECSSYSRFREDEDGNPEKNFWNTTGGELEETFKSIADELSNLRIVG